MKFKHKATVRKDRLIVVLFKLLYTLEIHNKIKIHSLLECECSHRNRDIPKRQELCLKEKGNLWRMHKNMFNSTPKHLVR